jgi:tetratricopeptide (TPR) repeat protein
VRGLAKACAQKATARGDARPPGTGWARGPRMLLCAALLLLTLLVPAWAQASLADAAFDSANKLYEQGKFAEAAAAYEKLLQGGQTSLALSFNFGNALFKSGHAGRAIAAYRQAEQLAPRDPDLRANLQFARNQVQGPTLTPTRWQRWLGRLTLNEWAVLTTASLWLFLLLLTLLQWRPRLKPSLRAYAITLAVLVVLFGLCTAAAFRQTRLTRIAVVTAPEATAHYGPLAESPNAFTVHDGAELLVLDQKDEWLQVSAGPRRTGWLKREQVQLPGG